MYKFCNKCGNITLGNKHLEEKCSICGNIKIPVPINYIQENEILTDKELADKKNIIIEDLVKNSPVFDQDLFNHKDEILAKQSAEFNAKLENGKAVLDEQYRQPECPTCHSKNVQPISGIERGASIVWLGIFSKKINKSYKCKHCGYTW